MYHRILVPVDGSKVADRALDHAIRLARLTDARMCVIYVIEYPSTLYTSDFFDVEPFHAAMVDEAKAVLDKASLCLDRAGVLGEVRTIDSGDVGKSIADEIEHAVTNWQADLVVMGTHGRRGYQRLMLGSVAEDFARRSPVPILLIAARAQ